MQACMHQGWKKIKMPEAVMSCCQFFRSWLKWSVIAHDALRAEAVNLFL